MVVLAINNPALSQAKVSNKLMKRGFSVLADGVRRTWFRSSKLRLKTLEAKVADGKIETHHPCYLGTQDTYFVGKIKGVGYIYQ